MITGGSCPHRIYRITRVSPCRHAATDDYAEALTVTVSPRRIGELAQAALVLTRIENVQLRTSC
jgi:hypothetical protein